ncbi:beta-N-acetylhexosaminidase [Qipengyuania vesicularis]|uniref:beta-N-acetylhexosaminidase n=1 Tax=Qipengyuania vesicularis TaxID=2867232 RepID=UPI001C873E00|nr:beta-N-acetylhexosaminidase [Qipengyuania vesicularis]MBX7527483.1 beta-N-acetylhexosaminidase [Qipengyuania vesicularis]
MTPAIFGISGLELTADERAFFKDADPAGYILFARNCETRDQMRALTDDLRAIHGRDRLVISIDQEGGRVTRMKPPEWSKYPAGEAFARLYEIAPASAIEAARVNAEAMARELAEVGVSVDYHAPLDVRRPETDDVIGDRSLGSEPMQVAALGRAVLDGMARGGVVGCLKHMPGHGRATVDSHKELPRVEASAEELEVDIEPFRTLSSHPLGMSAHIVFDAWDAENPATLSQTVIRDVIRGKIGFDGLLFTDDIDMQALEGTIVERGAKALDAGCDIILNCWAKMEDQQAIAARFPSLSQEAAARLDRVHAAMGEPGDGPETAELLAKRDALLSITEEAA